MKTSNQQDRVLKDCKNCPHNDSWHTGNKTECSVNKCSCPKFLDSQQDMELDMILAILVTYVFDKCNGLERGGGVTQAKQAILRHLEQETVKAEKRGELNKLEELDKRMGDTANAFRQTAINMAKKESGVQGLARSHKMASFGWMQAHRLVNEQLQALKASTEATKDAE